MNTPPNVIVRAFSGCRSRLPPKVMLIWPAEGAAILPIWPAGAPEAMQAAVSWALPTGSASWQGSVALLARPRLWGVNSSLMLGARTARW